MALRCLCPLWAVLTGLRLHTPLSPPSNTLAGAGRAGTGGTHRLRATTAAVAAAGGWIAPVAGSQGAPWRGAHGGVSPWSALPAPAPRSPSLLALELWELGAPARRLPPLPPAPPRAQGANSPTRVPGAALQLRSGPTRACSTGQRKRRGRGEGGQVPWEREGHGRPCST